MSAVRVMADGVHLLAAPGQLTLREQVAHEHLVDRLQVVVGVQVEDGEVLVVEVELITSATAS